MKRLISWKTKTKATPADNRSISYRIMFVSPFFELEVSNGYHEWQPVRAQQQVRVPSRSEVNEVSTEMSIVYPLLRFTSFATAEAYARDHLGLTKGPSWWSRYFGSAPASKETSGAQVSVVWPNSEEPIYSHVVISAAEYLRELSKITQHESA